MGLGKWEVVVVTEVFDDVQNYRLACVYNVHSIVLRVYYKLVSSSFFFLCACCLSGIYQWLVETLGAQSFASTLCLEHCSAALVCVRDLDRV